MTGKGVTYDTGFHPGGVDSRPHFRPNEAERDMAVIAGELGCTVVRITGGFADRIEAAAHAAARAGLAVWFSPFPCELGPAPMAELFLGCARRAEALRRDGAEVVLVLGCELSLFADGFLPGRTVYERIDRLSAGTPAQRDPDGAAAGLNAFLGATVDRVRAQFTGPVTYAAGLWEDVDWTPFDIVSVDAYRDAGNAASYAAGLARLRRPGIPLVVSEFGCCTYRGAADRGGLGWRLPDGPRPERDEREQVGYLRECLDAFDRVGVDTAFWFTYAGWDGGAPADDLHYGLVHVGPDGIHRKQVFDAYRRYQPIPVPVVQ